MKYAAKRTWPEKSPSWEHQGEADTMQSFASEFASVEQLGLDTEFVVMEKEGGEPEIQHFRVASRSPYQLVPVEQGQGGQAGARDAAAPAQTDTALTGTADSEADVPFAPDFRPAISMIFFMAKISVGAVVLVGILGAIALYVKKVLS